MKENQQHFATEEVQGEVEALSSFLIMSLARAQTNVASSKKICLLGRVCFEASTESFLLFAAVFVLSAPSRHSQGSSNGGRDGKWPHISFHFYFKNITSNFVHLLIQFFNYRMLIVGIP